MTEQEYNREIEFIFNQFPSYQKVGKVAYKPGIETMQCLDNLLGNVHKSFKTIHIAGTNGKGSTSHMLCAALMGLDKIIGKKIKVGLYTSPHLKDFRERIKVNGQMVPREFVYDFLKAYRAKFVELGASFFEITTALAFAYFAKMGVDVAVIECGLGGRLDSTNVITPLVSAITNIGLDHCEHLGYSLNEIAGEKAGIIKAGVPVVIGEQGSVAEVFINKAREVGAPIVFAEDACKVPGFARELYSLLINSNMDLKGDCQDKNTKTVSCVLDILEHKLGELAQGEAGEGAGKAGESLVEAGEKSGAIVGEGVGVISGVKPELFVPNICNAAHLTGLRGRWEELGNKPLVICDTGHNAHGFKLLGNQIVRTAKDLIKKNGKCQLYMVFGVVADKDLEAVSEYLPNYYNDGQCQAYYYYVNAMGARALNAEKLEEKMLRMGFKGQAVVAGGEEFAASVKDGLKLALSRAEEGDFIFVGGSTFVVAEVL